MYIYEWEDLMTAACWMKRALLASLLVAIAVCWPPDVAASVSARVITASNELLGGAYAEGQLGDFLMENDEVAFVVTAIGHSGNGAITGGNVIDAGSASLRADALGCLYTYFDDDWPRQAAYETLQILDDGSSGGPAVIRVTGEDSSNPALTVQTDYLLASGSDYLTLTSTITNTGGGQVNNFEVGDAFHWGDCESFVPGYGFSLPGSTSEPWIAGAASGVSYGYASPPIELWGPHGNYWSDINVAVFSLSAGAADSYTRLLIAGGTDVAAVATSVHALAGTAVGSLECTVAELEGGELIAEARIDAFDSSGDPYLQMVTDGQGQRSATVPPGDWRLVASATGYESLEAWVAVEEGETTTQMFELEPSGYDSLAIGDTLTVIQRPLLNIPAIIAAGDTLRISCVAEPDAGGWAAELSRADTQIPLAIDEATYDPTTLWWTLEAIVPEELLFELYNLRVTAEGGIDDTTANAVHVIPSFKESYYFIHITDTHLPTHLYYHQQGADTDTSEAVDLREVMDDINLIHPEFVLLTGDFLNEGELEDYLNKRYYTRGQRQLTEFQVPVYLTAGNHDIGGWDETPAPDGTARRDWWRFFGWKRLDDPPPGAPWYTQNYSFDYGPVHYTGLEAYDNYDMWRSEIYGAESFTAGQMQWLADDLASAAGSASKVLFYHFDFSDQINLEQLGVDMALWGHIHHDSGSIDSPPYDLATDKVCDGDRSYRLVRVNGGELTPTATMSAGSQGQHLRVEYDPANDGTYSEVTAQVTNEQDERFEYARLRFVMPDAPGEFVVEGGTLLQVDRAGEFAVCYVEVDLFANSSHTVTIRLESSDVHDDFGGGEFRLCHRLSNPFRPGTGLTFALPRDAHTRLALYDLSGRQVATLVDAPRTAGEHATPWYGEDDQGSPVPAGVYIALLRTTDQAGAVQTLSHRIVLLR